MPLTQELVCELQPRERPYKKHDAGGLYLLVSSRGSKSWRFAYRFNGRSNMLSFGSARYISLANARRQREAARALLMLGIDPKEARDRVKAAGVSEREVREAVKKLIPKTFA
jgi:hypothetical protein